MPMTATELRAKAAALRRQADGQADDNAAAASRAMAKTYEIMADMWEVATRPRNHRA